MLVIYSTPKAFVSEIARQVDQKFQKYFHLQYRTLI